MTDEEINITIAEACPSLFIVGNGVKGCERQVFWKDFARGVSHYPVDICRDLNAIMPLLPNMTIVKRFSNTWHVFIASASGQYVVSENLPKAASEFYLRTMGKWKE